MFHYHVAYHYRLNAEWVERYSIGRRGVVIEVLRLFQKSATPSGWTPSANPHCLPNS